MVWLFAVLIGLIGFATIYQAIVTKYELRKFPPSGKLIDVDGKLKKYVKNYPQAQFHQIRSS